MSIAFRTKCALRIYLKKKSISRSLDCRIFDFLPYNLHYITNFPLNIFWLPFKATITFCTNGVGCQ